MNHGIKTPSIKFNNILIVGCSFLLYAHRNTQNVTFCLKTDLKLPKNTTNIIPQVLHNLI